VIVIVADDCECAACGEAALGTYSIHRDGFGQGPEVPLCEACGAQELPTCEMLWLMIATRKEQ
jgi:hypothetical protein